MANTKKPCPGCGKVYSHRPVNELCGWCKRALELGLEIQKTMENRPKGTELVRVPQTNNWPYIHYQHGFHDKPGDRMATHFANLLELLGTSDGQTNYSQEAPLLVRTVRESQTYYEDWVLPKGLREIVYAIWEDLHALAESCYVKGRADGESFVTNMAAGKLSAAEISEHDEKLAKAVQKKGKPNDKRAHVED